MTRLRAQGMLLVALALVLAAPAAAPRAARAGEPGLTWQGDFRYRFETIDQAWSRGRDRHRIRARAGVEARVNDTVSVTLRLATTEGDPRSTNVTLSGSNSRKSVDLDLAYAEWRLHADWKLTAGKMRQPWLRPGHSVLFDADVNPEGLAVHFGRGPVFASVFYHLLEERGGSASTPAADSSLAGGQAGLRGTLGHGSRWLLGVGYYDFNAVQGRDPFPAGSSNGNTTTSAPGLCRAGIESCLEQDFAQLQLLGEYATRVGRLPLVLHLEWMRNRQAGNGLDTAWSAGVRLGKTGEPRTWEVGYAYQRIGKDALFGQFIDSDFAGGETDVEGSIVRAGYAIARDWTFNLTWFLNRTHVDVPLVVGGAGPMSGRDYRRLQLDLNFTF